MIFQCKNPFFPPCKSTEKKMFLLTFDWHSSSHWIKWWIFRACVCTWFEFMRKPTLSRVLDPGCIWIMKEFNFFWIMFWQKFISQKNYNVLWEWPKCVLNLPDKGNEWLCGWNLFRVLNIIFVIKKSLIHDWKLQFGKVPKNSRNVLIPFFHEMWMGW